MNMFTSIGKIQAKKAIIMATERRRTCRLVWYLRGDLLEVILFLFVAFCLTVHAIMAYKMARTQTGKIKKVMDMTVTYHLSVSSWSNAGSLLANIHRFHLRKGTVERCRSKEHKPQRPQSTRTECMLNAILM